MANVLGVKLQLTAWISAQLLEHPSYCLGNTSEGALDLVLAQANALARLCWILSWFSHGRHTGSEVQALVSAWLLAQHAPLLSRANVPGNVSVPGKALGFWTTILIETPLHTSSPLACCIYAKPCFLSFELYVYMLFIPFIVTNCISMTHMQVVHAIGVGWMSCF